MFHTSVYFFKYLCVVLAHNITLAISKTLIDKLKAAGLTQVHASHDSHIGEIHEEYRTKGSSDREIKSVSLFKVLA